eukprot:784185-Rhodomonas_salina.2
MLNVVVSCLIGQYKLNDTEELLDLIIPACKEKGGKLYLKAIQSRAFCLFKQYRYARLLSSSSSLQTCASSWGDLSISRPEPFRAQVQRGARHLPRAGVPGRAKRRAVSSAMLLGYLATPLVCAARYENMAHTYNSVGDYDNAAKYFSQVQAEIQYKKPAFQYSLN